MPAISSMQLSAPAIEATDRDLAAARARLAIKPSAAAHRDVARQYQRLGIPDLAHQHYAAATRLDPADASSYEMQARIWRDWGFPAMGLADAHRAIYYAPHSASALNTFATLLHAMGRYAEARSFYARALELEPRASYVRLNLCALDRVEQRLPAFNCGEADAGR